MMTKALAYTIEYGKPLLNLALIALLTLIGYKWMVLSPPLSIEQFGKLFVVLCIFKVARHVGAGEVDIVGLIWAFLKALLEALARSESKSEMQE